MAHVRQKEQWERVSEHIVGLLRQGWQLLVPDDDDATGERRSLGEHLKSLIKSGPTQLPAGTLKESFVAFLGDARGPIAIVSMPGVKPMALRRSISDEHDVWIPELDVSYHAPVDEETIAEE